MRRLEKNGIIKICRGVSRCARIDNMELPQRKSIRLIGYDYSGSGCYFVTICTQNRQMLFGNVGVDHDRPVMILNETGKIVDHVIKIASKRFPIDTDIYQIMPNHVHMIIVIDRAVREPPLQSKRSLLSQIIGFLKMNSSKSIHQMNGPQNIWQRNYYEHIIRNEHELNKIRKYIKTNPEMWGRDRNNPNFKN